MANEYRVGTVGIQVLHSGSTTVNMRLSLVGVQVLVPAAPLNQPGGHRYWRYRPTAGGGGNGYATGYLELDVDGESRWNANTSTSGLYTGTQVDYLFDNDPATRTVTAQPIQFDAGVGGAVKIIGYKVGATTTNPSENPTAWVLEYSDDASTWTIADTRSGQSFTSAEVKSISLSAVVVTGRRRRMTFCP